MRKLIVSEWVTLDGVFDADSMEQWFHPFESEDRMKYIRQTIHSADALLIGRVTYEMFAAYWPEKKNNEDGIADHLNSMRKYVVSTTLKKAEWNNSTIINEGVMGEIARLKQQPGRDILLSGSATLVKSLAETDLIDECRILVHPILMGSGKRFVKEGLSPTKLEVVKNETFSKGVVLLCYAPANE